MDNLGFLHGGNIYEVRRKYKGEIIDFSANINPLGLSKKAKEVILKNLDKISYYPDPKAETLIRKIAQYWGISEESILLGNGSVNLIYLITFAYRPKTALIPEPTFSEYERASKNSGSEVKFLSLKEDEEFRLRYSSIPKADMIFICNPNNPTGNIVVEKSSIEKMPACLCVSARRQAKLVVIDEAFMDFLPNEMDYTLVWHASKNENIIVLRSFTKFFALPGLRIGYLISHPKTVKRLKRFQPPWEINILAQLTAEAVLDDREYIKETHKIISRERKFLFEELKRIEGLRPYPSVTNFLLIKIEKGNINSNILMKEVIKKGILLRNCSNFRTLGNKFIRIAVRSHKENLYLLKTLKEIL
ncbi:MAG: Threonine-phosphate decarboxylase [Candidatus Methanoperedenaceae archaeon GB37]|nr:Threonine-phosphate decarboxylase [Candidatus Methanoperedenaceae archaeon GB37]CAD7783629.1 MAG: Threonine-phosphate decarboxylase [Candidatus Methanoperedenaceae archaeon GB37]